jgi:hypothetical protein
VKRAALPFAVSAALAVTGSALAHGGVPNAKAERSLDVVLREDGIRIAYRIGYGERLAAEQRRLADRNADFEVAVTEGTTELDARTAALLHGLNVCTGPTLERVECRKLQGTDVERVAAEGWVPGPSPHLHFEWTLKLPESTKSVGALRIEDAYEVAGVQVSDVRIDAAPGLALTRAGDGSAETKAVSRQFAWSEARRAPGPRVTIVEWQTPPQSAALIAGASLVAVLGLILAIWLLRRPARRRDQPL